MHLRDVLLDKKEREIVPPSLLREAVTIHYRGPLLGPPSFRGPHLGGHPPPGGSGRQSLALVVLFVSGDSLLFLAANRAAGIDIYVDVYVYILDIIYNIYYIYYTFVYV